MDLSPTDARLNSIDLYRTDEKCDLELTDILSKRPRRLLYYFNPAHDEPGGQIAARLTVGVETLRAYLKSIRAKPGVKTRTAIVAAVHGIQSQGIANS